MKIHRLFTLVAAVFAIVALASCSSAEKSSSVPAVAVDFDAELAKPGLVVVDFYATWCGPCKAMKPVIAKAEKDYAGKARIISIDVDQHSEIARRYNVSSIPDFVIFKDGKVLDNRVGAMPEADFRKWLDGFIAAAN